MLNSSTICVDANFVVRLVTNPRDEPVQRRWRQWQTEGRQLHAPVLMRYEVTNALHRMRGAGGLSQSVIVRALQTALRLPIQVRSDDELHHRALALAQQFTLTAAYDAHYLALADSLGAEFWTADQRLVNRVSHALSWVHLIQ